MSLSCCRSTSAVSTSARPAPAWHTQCSAAHKSCRSRLWSRSAQAMTLQTGFRGPNDIYGSDATSRQGCMPVCAAAANMTASEGAAAIDNMEPTVEEVMTPHPTVLEADMHVRDAVHVLLEQDISGAPVVDASGKLVGVLSESDLIWKGAGVPQDHYLLPPVFLGFADAFIAIRDNPKIEEEVHKILARTVRDAMTAKVEIATPAMPMSEAASLMLARQINMLPVVEGGKVVGVVTRHDVLRGIYASKSPFL